MYKFTLYTKLPTLNEYINLERTNKFLAANLKKKYTDSCRIEFLGNKRYKLDKEGLYSIKVVWTVENNRVDSDNLFFGVKFLLDGLVKSNIISGDSRKYIKNIYHEINTGEKYRIDFSLVPEEK